MVFPLLSIVLICLELTIAVSLVSSIAQHLGRLSSVQQLYVVHMARIGVLEVQKRFHKSHANTCIIIEPCGSIVGRAICGNIANPSDVGSQLCYESCVSIKDSSMVPLLLFPNTFRNHALVHSAFFLELLVARMFPSS
jgi:hypothetical protein